MATKSSFKDRDFILIKVNVMSNIQNLIEGLKNRDNKQAYRCLEQLGDISSRSAEVYPFLDVFVEMLNSPSSYIRTRGIILIAANAKWDVDNRIDEIIGDFLKHITDEKPITARKCIKVLPIIAKYKPDLKNDIENALHRANPAMYKDSMRSLVLKDIQATLEDIRKDSGTGE